MKKLVTMALAIALLLSMAAMPAVAEEYVQLTWAQGTGADAPLDNALVLEELNKISRELLGVEVDIKYFTDPQLQLATQAGEFFDMYFTCDWYNNYNLGVRDGLFADITELVKTVTPDLYATMPEEVWEMAKINGTLYAIPVKKDYCPQIFIVYDKDFYDSINMAWPEKFENLSELTPYLAAYKEAKPDEYPIMMGGYYSGFDGIFNYVERVSTIGVPYNKVGTEAGRTIVSVFEDEEMLERCRLMYQWMQAGYCNPDAAQLTETAVDSKHDHIKVAQCWQGYDYSPSYGYTCGLTLISGPYLSTSGVQGSMNAFSSALEEDPERLELCLKYQELVNTNLQYRDTLRYGIEGVHFNYTEKGAVIKTELGTNNYAPWPFSQGSYALSSIQTAENAPEPVYDQWDQTFAAYETAIVSETAGFVFDATGFDSIIAELSVIKDKYIKLLFSGTVDPDVEAPKCIAEMEAAGLRDLIAAAQEQLDAFIAARDAQ